METAWAMRFELTEDTLTAVLPDGQEISVPLAGYPCLIHATPEERNNWELIGTGQGIHWPDLDEDLSIEGFLAGRRSGETPRAFKRWLEAKQTSLPVNIYEIRPTAPEEV